MRTSITSNHKNLFLREAKRNPHLGVRALSVLLSEKYKIKVSKSTVSNVLKSKGIDSCKGRKRHAILYQRKYIKDCAYLLLKAVDSQIGLCDFLKGQLHTYLPHLSINKLKNILLMFSFSSYVGGAVEKNIKRPGFLRLCNSYSYPAKSIKYFRERIAVYKPAISLDKIKENARLASTIKFYFMNNSIGYCDAKLSTLWDGPCGIEDFFLPLHQARERLAKFQKDKTIIVSYTKSFDYISAITINFINGISTGVKGIDILDEKGKVLEKMQWNMANVTFLLGYYPKILNKNVVFLEKNKKFKRFTSLHGEMLYMPILTRFSQAKENKAVILNNILIKNKEKTLPNWAILTAKKINPGYLLKEYLFSWPYLEKAFLNDMAEIENFFKSDKRNKESLSKHIPGMLTFEKESDFIEITNILMGVFKEQFGNITFTGNAGEYILGKEFCKLVIKNISPGVQKEINNADLYLDNRRLFLP